MKTRQSNDVITIPFTQRELCRLVKALGITCWIAGDGAVSTKENQEIALVDGLQGRLEKALKAQDAVNAGTN